MSKRSNNRIREVRYWLGQVIIPGVLIYATLNDDTKNRIKKFASNVTANVRNAFKRGES